MTPSWLRRLRLLLSLTPFTVLLIAATGAVAADDPPYTVTDLGDFGYAGWGWTYAEGINAAGDVVGYSCMPVPSGCHSEAFVYSNGALSPIGTLGGQFSWASDINASGVIVGAASKPDTTFRAFRYENGVMSDLDPLGGSQAQAKAINDAGTIVGWANPPYSGLNHAFVCEGSSCTDLNATMPAPAQQSLATDVNDAGDVVGFYISGSYRAFLYRDGTTVDLPALGSFSQAAAVNADGLVAGYANGRAVLWDASDLDNLTVQDLGTLGGYYSWATDVDASGQVVGGSYLSSWEEVAFLYREGRMIDLNTLIPSDSGWRLARATAINDAGQIVGYGFRPDALGLRGFLLTPLTPAQRIANLIATVRGFQLSDGMATSFVKKLENALASLEAGDTATACDEMLAFSHHSEAQSGKALTEEQAMQLVADATAVRTAIGCP